MEIVKQKEISEEIENLVKAIFSCSCLNIRERELRKIKKRKMD